MVSPGQHLHLPQFLSVFRYNQVAPKNIFIYLFILYILYMCKIWGTWVAQVVKAFDSVLAQVVISGL